MNALNRRTSLRVVRTLPPLVFDAGHGCFAWVENGYGFLLNTRTDARWAPLTDVVGIGGHVLVQHQIDSLIAGFGRPL